MRRCRVLSALAVSGAAAVVGAAAVAGAAVRPVTPGPAASPLVLIAPDITHVGGPSGGPPSTASCERSYRIACYSPSQLRRAYRLPELLSEGITGQGQTIVIVDSFGSPTVRRDLQVFDAAFHLPPPPALTVIQ